MTTAAPRTRGEGPKEITAAREQVAQFLAEALEVEFRLAHADDGGGAEDGGVGSWCRGGGESGGGGESEEAGGVRGVAVEEGRGAGETGGCGGGGVSFVGGCGGSVAGTVEGVMAAMVVLARMVLVAMQEVEMTDGRPIESKDSALAAVTTATAAVLQIIETLAEGRAVLFVGAVVGEE
jgi:hypothetical protein